MKAKKTVLFFLIAALAVAGILASILFLAPRKPNIVFITVDALRADYLGAYGFPKDTSPRIDAFAKESLVFTNAYCTVPKTSGSFASIMTGLHPFFHKTAPIRDYLREDKLTMAEFLRKNGYETAAIVENANLSKAFHFNLGFESYTEVWKHVQGKAAATPFITAETRKFLGASHRKPFFLWVHYIDTHAPYVPPDEFVRYDAAAKGRDISRIEKKIIAGTKVEKEKIKEGLTDENYFVALYEGCVRYVDSEIGKVLETLGRKALKNTVVIISADHGEELGEHNLFFDHGPLTFQSSTRVPLIVRIPGRKNDRIDRPVSLMDIFPTIAEDILHKKIPTTIQGVSLFRSEEARRLYIYGQFSHAVVTGGDSFIEIVPPFAKQLDLDTKHSYDNRNDPAERRNLIASRYSEFLLNANLYARFIDKHKYPVSKRKARTISEQDLASLKSLGYFN